METIVQLIEPDGTLGLKMGYKAAVEFCKNNPGWSWAFCDESI